MKKVVIASMYLPDGRVVLQRRTLDAPINAGLLGHFGGHVETGETFDQAIRRELAEETSLPIDELAIKPLLYFVVDREGKLVEYHPYEIMINDMSFDVYEGEKAEAYTVQEALERDDLTSSVKYMLQNTTGGKNVSAN